MVFAAVKSFLFGPDFNTLTGDPDADLENVVKAIPAGTAVGAAMGAVPACASADGAIVEVSLEAPAPAGAADKAKQGSPAFSCALGPQLRSNSIAGFDRDKQVYSKQELSPLPFQPPPFHTYATSMLAGTFKVFQYVVTVMVALMVMQHAVQRYWSLNVSNSSAWQDLLFVVFISYPMITLMLVVLTNNEICVRRFMYYRLMSLQVIIDFENTPMYRLWFFVYYSCSFVLLLVYSFWAGWLTSEDKTVSVWPQMSIVAMQSMLLFMFWLNIVSMEEQLVPLNKVIENSPQQAKELISHCEVVKEAELKAVLTRTYRRKRAFKRLSHAEQDREGRVLMETGSGSLAAFFDLNSLRNTSSRRRHTQEAVAGGDKPAPRNCLIAGLCKLGDWIDDILWRKLYALTFAITVLTSVSVLRMKRSGRDRAAATLWPYPADAVYFRAMAVLSGICALAVFAIEAYAIWFVLFASDMTDQDKFGILECKMCYDYQQAAGATCVTKPETAACWGAAKRGYCSMLSALVNSYGMNSTEVVSWDTAACASQLG